MSQEQAEPAHQSTEPEDADSEPACLAQARKVADTVLYEGYLLYPYHKSAQKNQSRFQFGVLMPPAYHRVDPSEPHLSQTECLIECPDGARVFAAVRFLQMQHRQVMRQEPGTGAWHAVDALAADDAEYTTWDEAVEREQRVCALVSELLSGDLGLTLHVPAGQAREDITDSAGRTAGRIVRSWSALDGVIRLRAERVPGPYGTLRLGLRVENHSDPADQPRDRDDGLRHALIATHALIWVPGGAFLSMTDPPEWAASDVAACENIGTWPVLGGPEGCSELVLSSPVILYDHAEVAPESPGDLFDATEIDEILTLRTIALTDDEKRAARATDPLAAELMDRLDGMPPEIFGRLHGAIRTLNQVTGDRRQPAVGGGWPAGADGWPGARAAGSPPAAPWWDPGSDTSVSPETDQVMVAGLPIARGSRVRMCPASGGWGSRRADAQDLFIAGREAIVEAVLHDVDGYTHVAVSPVDDPAADLRGFQGRYLYFSPDELQPIGDEPDQASKSGTSGPGRAVSAGEGPSVKAE